MATTKQDAPYWRLFLARHVLLLAAASVLAAAAPCRADSDDDPRDMVVGEINRAPSFLVRVDVDHPDRVYQDGEPIQASVRSERDGYLYLFYCDAARNVSCLFPNRVQQDNLIPANTTVVVPDQAARFQLRVVAPFGREVLKAVVTSEPLETLELKTLTKGNVTPLKPDNLKAVFGEVQGVADLDTPAPSEASGAGPRAWAEHQVQLTTNGGLDQVATVSDSAALPATEEVLTGTERPAGELPSVQDQPIGNGARPKRIGVFIGVSDYQDPGIRSLRVSHRDAQSLAAAMKQYGRFDESVVLVNEEATLRNIQYVIQDRLPAATRSGDLVLIYWSGHGGRTSNLDGTEPDGYDEYLVPHDGRLEPADAIRQTMLLDKTFGRWVQELDGRVLVVIIDACHSGGQTQGAVKALTAGDQATPFRKFFFATTLKRTKDIGQRETAVLASSRATQVSFERREQDLSVMTHFLIEKLSTSTAPVTLIDAADYVSANVSAFVEEHYPGTTQTPVFVNQTTPPVYLRP
jgi:hypothetical protein